MEIPWKATAKVTGQPTVTAAQGVMVTRIVDAIYRSAEERAEIPLT